MYTRDRYLQHLRKRFTEWVPWLAAACGDARVTIVPGAGTSFSVQVEWQELDELEIKKFVRLYNEQNIGTMRNGCLKPYAREIILKVLEMRKRI